MKFLIDVEENLDDAGVPSYKAWYQNFSSAWAESPWEAIEDLAEIISEYEYRTGETVE